MAKYRLVNLIVIITIVKHPLRATHFHIPITTIHPANCPMHLGVRFSQVASLSNEAVSQLSRAD
jgi:hypothetical protein